MKKILLAVLLLCGCQATQFEKDLEAAGAGAVAIKSGIAHLPDGIIGLGEDRTLYLMLYNEDGERIGRVLSNQAMNMFKAEIYYSKGKLRQSMQFNKDFKPEGAAFKYYANGHKGAAYWFKNGALEGEQAAWYENGKQKFRVVCSGDQLVSGVFYDPNGKEDKLKPGKGNFCQTIGLEKEMQALGLSGTPFMPR